VLSREIFQELLVKHQDLVPEDQLLFTKRRRPKISAIEEEEKKVSPIPSERA
jgi:hypothetical protein